MAKFIRTPFATSGDVQQIDEAAQPNGIVSFTQGYGALYEADKTINPNARNLERDKFNYLMNLVTAAIREFQTQSIANYILASDNGGVNYPYTQYATVFYNNSVYVSLKNNNTDLPTITTSWEKVDLASYLLSSNNLSDLTNTTTARNNLGLGTAAVMNHQDILPVGTPIPWATAIIPLGWLQCNGQSFSATRAPLLAQAFPSLTLPDLRGEFIRGWDSGRMIDNGRVMLSYQGDAIRNISGFVSSAGIIFNNFSGAFYDTGSRSGGTHISNPANETDDFGFDASREVPTANENRPRNIAFNYIVREL